jgi:hypothetical protein
MDKTRKRRERRLVLRSRSRRAERARAARNECEVNTQGMKQRWRNLHIMLLANVEAATVYMHTPEGQYDVEKHWQVDRACTVKMMGRRNCGMREAQSKSFQCTIPISVFEQSDLLLRYSTVHQFSQRRRLVRLREYLALPVCLFQNAALDSKPTKSHSSNPFFMANMRHQPRPGSC